MKILPEQVSQLCRPFGRVLSVIILHGRGQAIVEMDSASAVDSFLLWASQESDASQNAGIIAQIKANAGQRPVGHQKLGKLWYKSWAQSALAERGRPRSNRHQHDINSIIGGADSSSGTAGCGVNQNTSNDEANCLSPSSSSIRRSTSLVKHHNFKEIQLATDIVLREVGRCMKAVVREIVYRDSEERMRARKIKKKQHDMLLKEMKKERDDRNDDKSSIITCDSDVQSEHKLNQSVNLEREVMSKSEHFLSDWRSNKYCLKKEEMSLICWHYVASGENTELCPHYHPNRYIKDNNSNKTVERTAFKASSVQKESSSERRKEQTSTKHNRSASVCPAFHISRPVTEIPISLRVFEVDDFFPIARYFCSFCEN